MSAVGSFSASVSSTNSHFTASASSSQSVSSQSSSSGGTPSVLPKLFPPPFSLSSLANKPPVGGAPPLNYSASAGSGVSALPPALPKLLGPSLSKANVADDKASLLMLIRTAAPGSAFLGVPLDTYQVGLEVSAGCPEEEKLVLAAFEEAVALRASIQGSLAEKLLAISPSSSLQLKGTEPPPLSMPGPSSQTKGKEPIPAASPRFSRDKSASVFQRFVSVLSTVEEPQSSIPRMITTSETIPWYFEALVLAHEFRHCWIEKEDALVPFRRPIWDLYLYAGNLLPKKLRDTISSYKKEICDGSFSRASIGSLRQDMMVIGEFLGSLQIGGVPLLLFLQTAFHLTLKTTRSTWEKREVRRIDSLRKFMYVTGCYPEASELTGTSDSLVASIHRLAGYLPLAPLDNTQDAEQRLASEGGAPVSTTFTAKSEQGSNGPPSPSHRPSSKPAFVPLLAIHSLTNNTQSPSASTSTRFQFSSPTSSRGSLSSSASSNSASNAVTPRSRISVAQPPSPKWRLQSERFLLMVDAFEILYSIRVCKIAHIVGNKKVPLKTKCHGSSTTWNQGPLLDPISKAIEIVHANKTQAWIEDQMALILEKIIQYVLQLYVCLPHQLDSAIGHPFRGYVQEYPCCFVDPLGKEVEIGLLTQLIPLAGYPAVEVCPNLKFLTLKMYGHESWCQSAYGSICDLIGRVFLSDKRKFVEYVHPCWGLQAMDREPFLDRFESFILSCPNGLLPERMIWIGEILGAMEVNAYPLLAVLSSGSQYSIDLPEPVEVNKIEALKEFIKETRFRSGIGVKTETVDPLVLSIVHKAYGWSGWFSDVRLALSRGTLDSQTALWFCLSERGHFPSQSAGSSSPSNSSSVGYSPSAYSKSGERSSSTTSAAPLPKVSPRATAHANVVRGQRASLSQSLPRAFSEIHKAFECLNRIKDSEIVCLVKDKMWVLQIRRYWASDEWRKGALLGPIRDAIEMAYSHSNELELREILSQIVWYVLSSRLLLPQHNKGEQWGESFRAFVQKRHCAFLAPGQQESIPITLFTDLVKFSPYPPVELYTEGAVGKFKRLFSPK